MNVTVYLGANYGTDPTLQTTVAELGQWIGKNGHTLVYVGSASGLLVVLAGSVMGVVGPVVGVVALVFITNMEQYAINGYEVDALDFVIKPINYYRFSSMMLRALRNLPVRDEKEVILQAAGTISRMRI